MIVTDLFESRDMCNVCGQTPCNCTHVAESALKDKADLDAKRQALQQMEREPGHDAEAIRQRKLDLEREARARGLNEQGVAEASPEATFNALKGLKSWQVVIMNNYYRGKYSDYSGRYFYVLATSPEEAKQVVLDNADAILKDLLAMKAHNGRSILPRNHAVRITADRIGRIEDGTEHGRLSTSGFKKMYSPQGVMMVKLNNGAIEDVQGQEQGVAEGSDERKQNALWAQITAHEKAAKQSKDLKRQHHLKMADQLRSQLKTSDNVKEAEQQKGADYRDPPEADYGPEYQDMVARVKKLAGLGPMKTVYDPNKRVYRNMPTAVQPKK